MSAPAKPPDSPAAALARLRWAKPGADRDQPRRAGLLGGRPRCVCGKCPACERRKRAPARPNDAR
jgi:hypothetical protein